MASDCGELIALLVSSVKTIKKNNNKDKEMNDVEF